MTRRRVLTLLVVLVALIGVGAAATPFLLSLGPSAKAEVANELRIPLADVPHGTYKEFPWGHRRLFVGQFEELRVFLVPYMNGMYLLPDPDWNRPVIVCPNFGFQNAHFQCLDPNADSWLRENIRWNERGASLKQPYADLQRQHHVVGNGEIIVGRAK